MKKVIVDTDFLNHILKSNNGQKTLQAIIELNEFELLMNCWVYEREIKGIFTDIQNFVDEHVTIINFTDFLKNEDEKNVYAFEFRELFYEMNNEKVSLGAQTCFTYKKAGENLGEIHSVIMARFMNIPLLLSDDYNAKEIAAKRINLEGYVLDVINSFDILCNTAKIDKNAIPLGDAIAVIQNSHYKQAKDYIKIIKEVYKQ